MTRPSQDTSKSQSIHGRVVVGLPKSGGINMREVHKKTSSEWLKKKNDLQSMSKFSSEDKKEHLKIKEIKSEDPLERTTFKPIIETSSLMKENVSVMDLTPFEEEIEDHFLHLKTILIVNCLNSSIHLFAFDKFYILLFFRTNFKT
jgi:hypothetical protein